MNKYEELKLKFTSRNSNPVGQTLLMRDDWLEVESLVEQQAARIEALSEFADIVIAASFDGIDLEGGEIQQIGTHTELLQEITAKESCGDHCGCAEHGFPLTCYRKTYTQPPQGESNQ